MTRDSTAQYWATYLRQNGHPRAADLIEREISIEEEQATQWENADGERTCTICGDSVEEESYELWLFHKCESCVEEINAE